MKPTAQLSNQLYVDKVLAARKRSFEEKFLAAGNLFEAVTERMRSGILIQNPNASEEEIASELRRRFIISDLLENNP